MRRIAVSILILLVVPVLLFGMLESTAKSKVLATWGADSRLAKYYVPVGSKWVTVYMIGVQEYWPNGTMVDTPFGRIPSPRAGEPYPYPTCKGFGSSWDAAFKSFAAGVQCRWTP